MRSMTGYGTAEGRVEKGLLFVEIKSINHRFSEFNVKIPGRMSILEPLIRSYLQPLFQRGKVDIFFKEKEPLFGGVTISIDTELARKYHRTIEKLRRELKIKVEGDFLQTVGLDRLIKVEEHEGSYDRLWGQIGALLKKAVAHVIKMQMKEGEHLGRDQAQRLTNVNLLVKNIRSQSARVMGQNFDRVRRKAMKGNQEGEVDEQRLQMEVAFLGGRQDIAEETTRLESHVKQYAGLLRLKKEPIGRKLDFILQEMNREINTIGSKAADAHISRMVVDCKAELERLKEQVQNVE
ncbi:MAG: YicC/YloC family endoribonuclease [Pseudomonadota bacterium]